MQAFRPGPTTHDSRRTTHDARRTTHDARLTRTRTRSPTTYDETRRACQFSRRLRSQEGCRTHEGRRRRELSSTLSWACACACAWMWIVGRGSRGPWAATHGGGWGSRRAPASPVNSGRWFQDRCPPYPYETRASRTSAVRRDNPRHSAAREVHDRGRTADQLRAEPPVWRQTSVRTPERSRQVVGRSTRRIE
jgi:hypothetical protein